MFPYGRSNLSTPTVRNSGTPRRSVIPIGDEDKSTSPYFSRLFASPSVRSNNSSYFSPSSLSHRSSVFNRELPPSLFNFQSPPRRPIQSPLQPSPRPKTATEFLRNATSSVIERAIQKFEYNNRKRPIEPLTDGVDENVSISDRFSSKRYHGFSEDNNSSQNAANYSPIETTLPRPRLKPTSSSSLPRPSSAKLPQQVSRLSSAALEAIAFAAAKRQRPSDNLEKDSIRVGENDDVSLAPPAAKRRAMRDCETQTVFQVDSATSTRESSPEKLPKRRPPNMTSVNQLFARLEAKARATSSNLRLAALRKIGGGLASSSLEDRQAYIRRIFEEITDKDSLKFGDGHKSFPNASFNSLSTTATVSSSLTTPVISTQTTKSTVPSISLNSETTSKSSESGSSTTLTSTVASTSPLSSFSFGKTSTSTEILNVSSITPTLPSFSFGKTSLPGTTSNASSPSLSVASGAVSTSNTSTLPSFSFGKSSLPEKTSVDSSESSVLKPLPSFSFEKVIDVENKTGSTTITTSTSSLSVPPSNVSVSSSGIDLPSFGKATASTAAEKTASGSATSGVPSFKFCFGAGTTVKSSSENISSPAAGGFNFSLAKTTSNRQESSTKPTNTSTGFGFSLKPKSTVATSLEETEKFIFGQTSTVNSNTAVTTSSGSAVFAFGLAPNSTSTGSTAPGFVFSASPSNGTAKSTVPSFSFSSTSTESQKTSAPVSTTSSALLFNFSGKPTTATTTASGGFNFPGNLAAVTNTTSVGSSSTAPAFNFSAIALPKPGTATTTNSTPAFNFSTTPSTTASISSPFSLPKTAGTTVPPPTFNFSLKPSMAPVTTTQSSLLDISFSAGTATAPSTFVFSGIPSTTSSTPTVGFETSGFNFPTTKTTTAPSVLAPAKIMPSFSFSSAITNTTTTASSSLFSFSTNQPSTASTTGGFSFSGATTTSSARPFGFSTSSQNPTLTTPPTFGFGSTTNSSPFAFNKTGLSNGTSSASPFGGTQNAATTTASSNPFGFSGANAAATTATTAGGFGFSVSPSLFKFGASGQNAPATSTTQSVFSLNLPTIKSSPSIFSTGEATKRPVDSSFTTSTDANSTSAKIGFGGISASNPTPFSSAPAFNFGGSSGTNFTGFNFNTASTVSGFNFGVSATNPPVFGGSGQASPNPFSAQPTTPNAAASFAQRRRQLRTTRRR
ncbi:unnamed protein product [Hymenolepis diminuta]|uniref:RanBP1 domain-containing protein n=1 Tax=Hymenolepis diminuta TaxID=6216 RepID=A0A0R3SD15_HYMDI|nr:unnamed protein product [Hymenolepis diminuta]VUZ42539.1 unnamed protein product [Hymenolepis diminuta]